MHLLQSASRPLSFRTQEGQTALQLAISNQLPLVVDAICTRGADMSVVDEKGNPPLWLALENGLEDIASTLVSPVALSHAAGHCVSVSVCVTGFRLLTV